jgi:hypothetical protein
MKLKIVAVTIAVLSAGCQSWPNKRFEAITGVPISKGISLCPTAAVSAQKDCKPDFGGLQPWNKVTNVYPLQLDPAMKTSETTNYVAAMYLGHLYRNDTVLFSCPTVNPFTDAKKDAYKNYFAAFNPIETTLATIYSETAVKEAKAALKASASRNQPAISADGMAKFDAALRQVFEQDSASNAKVVYVQAVMPSGLEEIPGLFPEYAKCLDKVNGRTDSVITGVTGFFLEEFSQSTKVYKDEMFSAAIEVAANASPRDRPTFENVKAEASAKWSDKVNQKLTQVAKVDAHASAFYPLWIRFDTP